MSHQELVHRDEGKEKHHQHQYYVRFIRIPDRNFVPFISWAFLLESCSFQRVHASLQACVTACVHLDDCVICPPDDEDDVVEEREEGDVVFVLPRPPCDASPACTPEVSPRPQLWLLLTSMEDPGEDGAWMADALQVAS